MVLDHNVRVQKAGCCSFATLEMDAGPELAPYLEPILRNLAFAFDLYQPKNMPVLYDAIGTLADAVGRALQNPTFVEILMSPITTKWAEFKDDDEELIVLFECLLSVTIAVGPAFLPYAPPVFDRCTNIIFNSILQDQAFQIHPDLDEPDNAFLVIALDLLSGLTQALGMSLEPLVNASQPNVLSLLTVCLNDQKALVRQSAYALVGDLAMGCFSLLRPHMSSILASLTLQLDPKPTPEFISVLNNAAWSVGEVVLRYGRNNLCMEQNSLVLCKDAYHW